jgi:hypothetical protein
MLRGWTALSLLAVAQGLMRVDLEQEKEWAWAHLLEEPEVLEAALAQLPALLEALVENPAELQARVDSHPYVQELAAQTAANASSALASFTLAAEAAEEEIEAAASSLLELPDDDEDYDADDEDEGEEGALQKRSLLRQVASAPKRLLQKLLPKVEWWRLLKRMTMLIVPSLTQGLTNAYFYPGPDAKPFKSKALAEILSLYLVQAAVVIMEELQGRPSLLHNMIAQGGSMALRVKRKEVEAPFETLIGQGDKDQVTDDHVPILQALGSFVPQAAIQSAQNLALATVQDFGSGQGGGMQENVQRLVSEFLSTYSVHAMAVLVGEAFHDEQRLKAEAELGLPSNFDQRKLQKKYRELSRATHPDKNPDDKEGAEKKFQAIAAAYTFLKPFAKQSVVDNMERLEAELAENPQDAVKQVHLAALRSREALLGVAKRGKALAATATTAAIRRAPAFSWYSAIAGVRGRLAGRKIVEPTFEEQMQAQQAMAALR